MGLNFAYRRLKLIDDGEFPILFIVVLIFDVLHYHFIRDVPGGGPKISPAPKMAAPKKSGDLFVFLHQLI